MKYYEELVNKSGDCVGDNFFGAFNLCLMACLSTELISLSESVLKINIKKPESSKVDELKGIVQDLGFK